MRLAVLAMSFFLAACSAQAPKSTHPKQTAQSKPECQSGDSTSFESPVKTCKDGKWVVDEAATKAREAELAEDEAKWAAKVKHQKELWIAIRTRVITDAEMKEVLELGPDIIPYAEGGGSIDWCPGVSTCSLPSNYKEIEQARSRDAEIIFNNVLLNQFKMRTLAKPAGQP